MVAAPDTRVDAQPSCPTVDALVLAGDRGPGDPLLEGQEAGSKVMRPVAGRPMLARVLEALHEAGCVETVHVVGPEPERQGPAREMAEDLGLAVTWHAPAASPATSVAAVLERIPAGRRVLLVTGDHALLRPEWIREFTSHAVATEADVALAMVDWLAICAAWPESRRTRYRFRDGQFCGGNLFLFATPDGRRMASIWRRVEQDRKRPWRVVRLIGPGALVAFLARRLTLEGAFRRLSSRFGLRARPVLMDDPEVAVDVDKPEDLALVESILRGRDAERSEVT